MVDRDAEELRTASAELDGVIALPLDIASPENALAMVTDTVSTFGRIDALVNNAGASSFPAILRSDP